MAELTSTLPPDLDLILCALRREESGRSVSVRAGSRVPVDRDVERARVRLERRLADRPQRGLRAGAGPRVPVVLVLVRPSHSLQVSSAACVHGRVSAPNLSAAYIPSWLPSSPRGFPGDGHTIVYGAAWDGSPFNCRRRGPRTPNHGSCGIADATSSPFPRPARWRSLLGRRRRGSASASGGTLARLPLDANTPREMLTNVADGDWAPDGRDMAVGHMVQGKYQLEFPDRHGPVRDLGGRINHVRVSPDGKRTWRLSITRCIEDDRGAVCVIRLTGRQQAGLSEDGRA